MTDRAFDLPPQLRERFPPERLFLIALWGIIGFGILARSLGYFDGTNSLWHDEVYWHNTLLERPLTRLNFRPIGYMAITRGLVHLYNNEVTLRSLSYLGSIATLFVIPRILLLLVRSKVVILISMVLLTMNPILVECAKEFKPYGLEPLFHALLIWIALLYIKAPSPKLEVLAMATCGISLLFAYNIVYLAPAILSIILLAHRNQISRKILFMVVGGGLVFLVGLYLLNEFT